MTEIAAARGIAGTVINGVCRDVTPPCDQNYPLFSRGRFMRTGKDRVRLVAVRCPGHHQRREISPLDIICGDADGALAVPAERAEQIAEIAERIEDIEANRRSGQGRIHPGPGPRRPRLPRPAVEESMSNAAGGHSAATLYEAAKLPCACDSGPQGCLARSQRSRPGVHRPGHRRGQPRPPQRRPRRTCRQCPGRRPAGRRLRPLGRSARCRRTAPRHRRPRYRRRCPRLRRDGRHGLPGLLPPRHRRRHRQGLPRRLGSPVRVGGVVVHTGDLSSATPTASSSCPGTPPQPSSAAPTSASPTNSDIIADIRAGKTTALQSATSPHRH